MFLVLLANSTTLSLRQLAMHLSALLSPIIPPSSRMRVAFGPFPIACSSILCCRMIETYFLRQWPPLSLFVITAITAMAAVYNAVAFGNIPTAA